MQCSSRKRESCRGTRRHNQPSDGSPTFTPLEDYYHYIITTLIGAGMEVKTVKRLVLLIAAGAVGMFLKGAWVDAKEQAEEAANPQFRWTDKNRWE